MEAATEEIWELSQMNFPIKAQKLVGTHSNFSIKKVLPALCPDNKELDYNELDISNGGIASSAYKEMREQSIQESEKTSEKLFEYCRLDTYAMYAIYEKLLGL